MNQIDILNQEYRLARADYLNYILTEADGISVEMYDRTRVLLHNRAFSLLCKLNVEWAKRYGRKLISKDELQKGEKQLVRSFTGAPRKKGGKK